MNTDYIQSLRYKLQKRVRRLNSVGFNIYHTTLQHFWNFVNAHQLFLGIIEALLTRFPEIDSQARVAVDGRECPLSSDELENVAFSYCVLKYCAESKSNPELKIGYKYSSSKGDHNSNINCFNETFLEPFYEYLDEQIDEPRAILSFLIRYKHKCESYRRNELFKLWDENTNEGEKLLARNMYEYLFDQGLDLIIEPSSASGEVDLIVAQNNDHPLIAEAKIFNPVMSKSANYIVKGFGQIYRYTHDYNEPFGYLIIFNTSCKDIKFTTSTPNSPVPFVIHNNKTIFMLTIDIFPHKESASKRGRLEAVEIAENDLLSVFTDHNETILKEDSQSSGSIH